MRDEEELLELKAKMHEEEFVNGLVETVADGMSNILPIAAVVKLKRCLSRLPRLRGGGHAA